jgi:hypothetical protein
VSHAGLIGAVKSRLISIANLDKALIALRYHGDCRPMENIFGLLTRCRASAMMRPG